MATYTPEQIKDIIIRNPNKKLLEGAQATRKKLMMHLYGQGMSECLERMEYFENEDIHKARRRYAISNKDFFSRILNEEDQVFTALGGSVNYSMPDSLEKQMNGLTDDVSYGISLHNWVKEFGLKAYRADPMGVIFMEREAIAVSETGMVGPKCYPTYKASSDIYDYLPIGRKLEHVCFQLTPAQLQEFGISDENYKNVSGAGLYHTQTPYFRFVDDAQDTIFKRDGDSITIVESPVIAQKNPIENTWSRVPAFIASDLIKFDEPTCFASAVEAIVELADTFLYDRSIRDLQKKYHGFAKVVEPLLPCGTCHGTGLIKGDPCPSCSMPGAEKGTGYKLRTTVGDVAKFPIKILEDVPGFDFNRIFGYITPDIESWNKQDTSLEALEAMAYVTYWGVNNTQITGANGNN